MNVNKLDELLTALKSADRKELLAGQSLNELVAESGQSRAWVRERLQIALTKGWLKIGKKKEMDLNGNMVEVPSFQFIMPTEKKK